MSGIDATRKIVQMDKGARVVIVSAMEQENIVMEAINAGARDYILKPFLAEDILNTLDRVFIGDDQLVEKAMTKAQGGEDMDLNTLISKIPESLPAQFKFYDMGQIERLPLRRRSPIAEDVTGLPSLLSHRSSNRRSLKNSAHGCL